MLIYLLLICSLFSIIQSEWCPNVQTIKSFDAIKYMGKWYELERYPAFFEDGQRCITAQYSLNENGTINVNNTSCDIDNEQFESIVGIGVPEQNNPSNITVSFSGFGSGGKYWILDTDYTTYSLVYSFINKTDNRRLEWAWILGRDKHHSSVPATTFASLKKILSSKGSSTDKFITTIQDCKTNY